MKFVTFVSLTIASFILLVVNNEKERYLSLACIDDNPMVNAVIPRDTGRLKEGFMPEISDIKGLQGKIIQGKIAESIFLAVPSNITAKAHMWRYTRTPHLAGSKADFELAQYTKGRFELYGLKNTVIETVDGLLAEPISRSINMIKLDKAGNKVLFKASLSERALPSDVDRTSDTPARNQTFLGYSPSGTSQARFVYANYGRPEDFDVLKQAKVDVKNTIVIVRYGKCFRGLKIMNAQERGALGVLIYSDPADDGYSVGDVYPDGPWRPATSVQRGSVQFNSKCSGDPARYASKRSVEDVCGYSKDELIPKIPAIPLSYEDAKPLLEALKGPEAPKDKDFIGALPITYRLGPSPSDVVLNITVSNRIYRGPMWNVISVIEGKNYGTDRDRPVILGNHRDAWVFGAADPHSGSVVLLEVARGLGVLQRLGWKPRQSIILCSWSGEELGLLGSTAYGENNENGILKNALVYINVDVAVSGPELEISSSAVLGTIVKSVLDRVADPFAEGKKKVPLSKSWNHEIYTLGSGSDYAVFLDYLGIPSIDLRFASVLGRGYGTYHSIYDSYSWMATFIDRTFERHQALAKVMGLMALGIADAPVGCLAYNHTLQANSIKGYINEIDAKLKAAKFDSNDDIKKSMSEMKEASNKYLEASLNIKAIGEEYDDKVGLGERMFLDEEGLPKRKWFRHLLQAPGFYLGYDAEHLPGIVHAIREKDLKETVHEINKVTKALQRISKLLGSDTNINIINGDISHTYSSTTAAMDIQ